MKSLRKLIPAIAMLLVAAVALGSASFAWFTMSRQVTATGIELTAIAPTNLLISSTDITGAGTSTLYSESATLTSSFGTGKLIPASSKDGLAFFAANQIKSADAGAPNAQTTFSAVSTALADGVNGYYADFKLWLKTDGDVAIDVKVSQVLSFVADKTTEAGTNLDISGAVRFAILDGAGTALITGNCIDGSTALSTNNVYGPNGVGTSAGTNVSYFSGLTGPIGANSGTDHYKGVTITPNADATLFTVAAGGTPTAITVRVWIEGQDDNCVTLTGAKADFTVQLGFKDALFTE